MLRLATFKAQWQKNAKNFLPYYRDLLNQLEIKQMESVLRIGEGTWFTIVYKISQLTLTRPLRKKLRISADNR